MDFFSAACYQQICWRPSLKRLATLNTKTEESTEASVTVHQYTRYIPEGFNPNSLWYLQFYNKILLLQYCFSNNSQQTGLLKS
jgi:hypothetical protein